MTQGEKRIKIAEKCEPWDVSNREGSKYKSWADYVERVCGAIHEIPDYFNDLNAMHEAEKVLTNGQMEAYAYVLLETTGFREKSGVWTFHATAAQRAEAFGRALGLWI